MTVKAEAGGDLNLRSQQNIDDYHARNWSAGGRIGIINMPSIFTFNKSKMDSTYASVIDQTGIYAGQGGFDITVGGNTDLQGAVIGSEATPDKNTLNTGMLTWSDIENEAEYKSSSVGVNAGFGPGTEARNQGIIPNVGITATGNADSTTHSAISPGTIIVRDNPDQDLSGLSRDPSDALNKLGKIFDKKTVEEKQELAAIFGEVAFEEIHKISEKNGWKEGSAEKVLLDAFAGGLMAKLGGGNFASGAAGAGFTQMVQGELKKRFADRPDLWQWASLIVGSAAAAAVGEDPLTGGSTAVSETHNNELVGYEVDDGKLKIKLSNGDKIQVQATDGVSAQEIQQLIDSGQIELSKIKDGVTTATIVIGGAIVIVAVTYVVENGIQKLTFSRTGINITDKISKQMGRRGWDTDSIKVTVDNPYTTRTAVNKANGNNATAYFNKDGSYIVRDNISGDVIQVSNRFDPNWVPDATINNPYIP